MKDQTPMPRSSHRPVTSQRNAIYLRALLGPDGDLLTASQGVVDAVRTIGGAGWSRSFLLYGAEQEHLHVSWLPTTREEYISLKDSDMVRLSNVLDYSFESLDSLYQSFRSLLISASDAEKEAAVLATILPSGHLYAVPLIPGEVLYRRVSSEIVKTWRATTQIPELSEWSALRVCLLSARYAVRTALPRRVLASSDV